MKPGWRLSIDLVDGDEDFTIECTSREDANRRANEILKQGWAVRDRRDDSSNIVHEIVPAHRIRKLVVFEKVD